ncbi:MAG: UDP-N-acetylmuramate dehydrogenase [Muribaculaceae bacterium]|nr:UDP-N-acetylmuramate dehydrogenase [Muribaculaceae bacterium]
MKINFEKNKELSDLTTFHLPAKASLFASFESVEQLRAITLTEEFLNNETYILGGGSNILFNGDYRGLILHCKIKGIKKYQKDETTIFAIAGAGENWSDFVEWTISEGLQGLENLSGIPGTVGAAPVQNVGAYGVEAGDLIHKVECFDLITRETITLSAKQCNFKYRDSIFKNEGKGRYVILRVSFKLNPTTQAGNLEYGPLKQLEERLGHKPSISEVAQEIIKIRNNKLPDPSKIGSAGSFFKNPVVRIFFYKEVMSSLWENIPYYETEDPYFVKIPAGWLIENAGLKGFSIGGAQVYPNQCLVIANTGGATAKDVMDVANHVRKKVLEKFGVSLYPEVNIVDSEIKVTILGSGTSKGVPEIGCYCPVCRSNDQRDKRTRCSALVETKGLKILIDISPDFREQALSAGITSLDAALITHTHYDHVGGFDDLRPLCVGRSFPVYLKKDVNDDLHKRLDYCFRDHLYPGVPSFEMHEIDEAPFMIKGVKITPISVLHGELPIVGFRIGDFAYITDAKIIPEEEKEKLKGLDVLVINGLRFKNHFAHLTVDEALVLIDELKPSRAYLTHFCHEIGRHCDFEKKLPEGVKACYDGMVIYSH